MNVNKETIWHFTCSHCKGFWSIATMDDWHPKSLYCPHCGIQNKNDMCSCDHKTENCDCAPGCKCGCNRHYLDSETSFDMGKYT
jgi:hypothetical protein